MTKTNQPTRLDWLAWRQGPAGKWFFDTVLEDAMTGLEEERKEYLEGVIRELGQGESYQDGLDKAALACARMGSTIEGIAWVYSVDPFQEETDET